ncbi:MAG: DUF4058 family protein [bacterium]|nr:DUF4058 family protein [bacterium]
MPLHARRNLYRGVNAHLHSRLQHEPGGWKVFHNKHIGDLAEALDAQLPPGYEVGLTKSLQIVEIHPDIEDTYLTSLEVRYLLDDDAPGVPVVRIELLSPTNKPPGDGYLQYREKRSAFVQDGFPLLEIDYLHETRTPLRRVPSYPDREPESHPYLIAITDPRPTPEQGETRIYGFDVDQPIPVVELPLAGDDRLPFDFGAVYDRTFESLGYFGNRVDYAVEPEAMDRYSPSDQARIRARMAAVQAAFDVPK